jgi:hypothetical protein
MDDRPPTAGTGDPQLLAATAAGVATASALLHVPLLLPAGSGGTTVLHLTLALACLACAVHLWRRPGRAAWVGHVAVATVMLAHPVLTHAHHHAAPAGTGTAAWAPAALVLLGAMGAVLGLVRWALGTDVPVRRLAGQMPAAAGGSSGRRVPQA